MAVCLLFVIAAWGVTRLNLATQFMNILPVANGGTGANSVGANMVLSGPCLGAAGPPSFKSCGAVPQPNARRWAYWVATGTTIPTSVIGDVFAFSGLSTTAVAATATTPAAVGVFAQAGSSPGISMWPSTSFWNYSPATDADFQAYLEVSRATQQVTLFGFANEGSSFALDTTGDRVLFTNQSALSSNWQCTAITGGVKSDTDSGVAVDANYHRFEIDLTSSSANFLIDGASVCSLTSGLPAASTMMGYGTSGYSPTGTSYTVNVAWLYVESDF